MRQPQKLVAVLWALRCISCNRWVDWSIAAATVDLPIYVVSFGLSVQGQARDMTGTAVLPNPP